MGSARINWFKEARCVGGRPQVDGQHLVQMEFQLRCRQWVTAADLRQLLA